MFFLDYQYHHEYPYQYILLFSFILSIVAGVASMLFERVKIIVRYLIIILIFPVTALVSSIAGGMMWKLHDMMAGYFTTGTQFINDLLWGAKMGLKLGWIILLRSIPYNIIMLAAGMALIDILARIILKKNTMYIKSDSI
jgi:hypothetical protein